MPKTQHDVHFFDDEILNCLFRGNEQFLNLLLRQTVRTEQVIARSYSQGTWNQYSGHDLLAHLGRAVRNWQTALGGLSSTSKSELGPTILFMTLNSYTAFAASLAAVLAGYDVMFMPLHASHSDIKWCLDYFGAVAIATDIVGFAQEMKDTGVAVFDISSHHWGVRDFVAEPALLTLFRWHKSAPELRDAKRQTKSFPEMTGDVPKRIGKFSFISFGHDGFQRPEMISLDAMVVTANHLLIHLNTPEGLYWKTLEVLPLANPFSHVSRFCALLKNGVIGFPQLGGDFEAHLRILRPTVILVNPAELEKLANHVEEQLNLPGFSPRIAVGSRLDKVRSYLKTGRALKLPESIFDAASRTLLWASRNAIGQEFVKFTLADLQLVVHGLAPAREAHVEILGRLGVPVVET